MDEELVREQWRTVGYADAGMMIVLAIERGWSVEHLWEELGRSFQHWRDRISGLDECQAREEYLAGVRELLIDGRLALL